MLFRSKLNFSLETFLSDLQKQYPFIYAHLKQAKVFLNNHNLHISFSNNFHYEQINQDKNKQIIKNILNTYSTKTDFLIDCNQSCDSKEIKTLVEIEDEQKKINHQKLLQKALKEPLVQNILEVFKNSSVSIQEY